MKFCRVHQEGESRWGVVEGPPGEEQLARLLRSAPWTLEGNHEGEAVGHRALKDLELLAPVEPTKIVCVGRNYREHAEELGNEVPKEPLLFFKPPSSLIGPGQEIRRPGKLSQRVDYEGELALVVGKRCYQPSEGEDIRQYIFGYTCLNDVTARDLQNKDGQWTRAKGFDTFCPVGPVMTDEIDPWRGVKVETRVNGEMRQSGNTTQFIFSLDVMMRYIANAMTLMPGDVIATGTPKGVGPLQAGDVVEVRVEGIGCLRNPVADG
ncbi:MAG: fumarylacetoacetate hydrolase family protein [Acidobacteriales bacterium]|nr:fumarylacetoacetate hydrolase family protein [Terriglobales bacterium]